MRISDWSSDVCSSDLPRLVRQAVGSPRAGFHAGACAHLRVPDVVFEGRRLFQPAGANRDVADVADLVRAAQSLLLLPLHRTSLGLAGGRKSVRLAALRGHYLFSPLRGREAPPYNIG